MRSAIQRIVLASVSLLAAMAIAAQPPRAIPTNPDPDRDEWLMKLRDENPDKIDEALFDLQGASRKRIESIKPRLIELVNNPRPDTRQAAIEALTEIGPAADAMPAIETQLKDPSPDIRLAAAEAAWRCGGRADLAASICIAILRKDAKVEDAEHEGWLRESAARLLRQMGPDAAVALKSLMSLMDDPRESVRSEAASVLGALGTRYRDQVEGRLTAALGDPSGQVRLAAARGLGQIDAPLDRAVQVLIVLAKEEIPRSKEAANTVWAQNYLPSSAVEALGELESDAAPAVATLAELLKSHALVMRLEAATALGRIGPAAREAAPALSRALRETEAHSMPFVHHAWCVGDNAATALEQIGAASSPALIEALNDDEPKVRAWAARALGGIPEAAPQSVGPLSKRLEDSQALVRIETAKALGRLGPAAVDATPQLAKLLFNGEGVTSFRAGSGIGIDESTSAEAWRALLKIKPKAEQVVPPLVETLKITNAISYEAVCALRQFPAEAKTARAPLERLLKQPKTRVAAACALAFVAPDHKEIQAILQAAVFQDKDAQLFAALGVDRLAAMDVAFDADFRSRLVAFAGKHYGALLQQCAFRFTPDDERTTQSLVDAIANAHPVFDEDESREAEKTAIELVRSHPRLQQALLRELNYVASRDDGKDEDHRTSYQLRRRLRAAKILINARVEMERALACLSELTKNNDNSADSFAVDFLFEDPSPPREAIPLLTAFLSINDTFRIRADFYGNGGEPRVVGDLAALILAKLKAKDAMLSKLDSPDAQVRARLVRALGQLGDESVVNDLLTRTNDLDHQVRAETMTALGCIGQAHPNVRDRLKETLRKGAGDHRRSVRDAAVQALASWDVAP